MMNIDGRFVTFWCINDDCNMCVWFCISRDMLVWLSVCSTIFCMIYLLTCKHEKEQADRGWLIRVSFDVICVCDFASLANNKGDAGWLIIVSFILTPVTDDNNVSSLQHTYWTEAEYKQNIYSILGRIYYKKDSNSTTSYILQKGFKFHQYITSLILQNGFHFHQ